MDYLMLCEVFSKIIDSFTDIVNICDNTVSSLPMSETSYGVAIALDEILDICSDGVKSISDTLNVIN